MTPVVETSAPRDARSADLEHLRDENEARNQQSAKGVQTSAPRDPKPAETVLNQQEPINPFKRSTENVSELDKSMK